MKQNNFTLISLAFCLSFISCNKESDNLNYRTYMEAGGITFELKSLKSELDYDISDSYTFIENYYDSYFSSFFENEITIKRYSSNFQNYIWLDFHIDKENQYAIVDTLSKLSFRVHELNADNTINVIKNENINVSTKNAHYDFVNGNLSGDFYYSDENKKMEGSFSLKIFTSN